MPPILSSFADVAHDYDVMLCDLWGCLHDGTRALKPAVDALVAFRKSGGRVVLLTNAPRPSRVVRAQLDKFAVPRAAYDAVVSSGDAAQAAMAEGRFGRRVFHLGPAKDEGFFWDDAGAPVDVERVPLEEAEAIVCTGLFDDRTETPDDYADILRRGVERNLPLLCANPDIVVDYGDARLYCAGAIARAYTGAGGRSHYFGKPHRPIYDLSRARLAEATGDGAAKRIVCIGDGIETDIAGANFCGFDSVFVSGGIAAEQTGTVNDSPNPAKLLEYLKDSGQLPTYSIGFFR
ncbi:MAG: TIGR01459 family HAD-type hydrolase [Paracoccaceae bacterium]